MAKRRKPNRSNDSNKGGKNYDDTQTGRTGRRSASSGRRTRSTKEEVASTNDPAWYATSPELLRDAASIPFSWPTGTRLDTGSAIYEDVVPGVMAITTLPAIGSQMNVNSPVNVASNAIYTFVRHANSGHSNYDAPDLMMYLIAMSHVYSFITWCQRLLGMVTMYDQRNRYTPYALVTANNVNFENLKDNLANFRYWLNNFITKVASMAVPATMPLFQRLAFLYSNVYIDGPSIKDQMYMYTPFISSTPWMAFHISDTDQSGELQWMSFTIEGGGSYASVKDIMNYGNALFNAVWDQEDFGIMSGDILKAYGDNIIKLSPVPVDFSITPIYDPMVLHQMKNARLANCVSVSKITQLNGVISQLITVPTNFTDAQKRLASGYMKLNKVLSSDFEAPTPEVVIESTRLMVGYDSYTNYVHTGTEIAVYARVWYFRNSGELSYQTINWDRFAIDTSASRTGQNWITDMFIVGLIKAFKYAPEVFAIRYYAESGNLADANSARIWDVDNYAVLDQSDIIKMHEAAMMSLFAVPAIAKIS